MEEGEPVEGATCAALVPHDDGALATKVAASGAMDALLRHAPADVAARVAVFGLGVGALPLLARLRDGGASRNAQAKGQGSLLASPEEFSYTASLSESTSTNLAPSLLTEEELRARLGALDPAALAAELAIGPENLTREVAERKAQGLLEGDVRHLGRWQGTALAAVSSLERRSAYAFLGLDTDADADAIQKNYKQRALASHPDKGGSEGDFQKLQDMVLKLRDEEEAGEPEAGKARSFFQTLMQQTRERRESQAQEGESPGVSEEVKLHHNRLKMHDKLLELWQRAEDARSQLRQGPAGYARRGAVLAPLQQMVEGFALEVNCLPRGGAASAAAEKLLCRFIRQGLEVIVAAALVDVLGTVQHVAMSFTGILVRAAKASGPCPALEQRCKALLDAIAEVPKSFEAFFTSLSGRLENKAASEWRGCDESKQPTSQAAPAGVPAAEMARGATQEHLEPPACPFAAAVASSAPASLGPKAADGPGEGPPSCPFAAAVAAQGASSAARTVRLAERLSARMSEAVDVLPPQGSLVKHGRAQSHADDWGKLRAFCVRHKFCVDFNRDSAGTRCTAPFGLCEYRHACAICGAEERGGPGAQYNSHGGWNCARFQAWLLAHGSSC